MIPTNHLRWYRRKVQGSESNSYEETVLQQYWVDQYITFKDEFHKIDLTGELKGEWRDIPLIVEG